MIAKLRRMTVTALAAVMALSLVPGAAYASAFDVIVKEYRYMASEGFDVPAEIEEGGSRYELASAAEPIEDPEWERPKRTVTHTETVSIPAADLSRASGYFDDEVEFDEDGYRGTLAKADVSTTPEHEVLTRKVDRTVTYSGLPDNDVNRIPAKRDFTVSAADGTQVKTLALSDVTYVVESVDAYGLPSSYTCHANYRGEEEYLTTPGYTAVCTYEGEVELVDTQMLVTATYAWSIPSWVLPALGAIALAAVGGIARFIYILWWRKKKAIVWRIEGDRETLLERVPVREIGEGRFQVDIPGDVIIDEMTPERFYEVELPEKYLSRNVLITQNELVLFDDVAAHRRIRVLNPFD